MKTTTTRRTFEENIKEAERRWGAKLPPGVIEQLTAMSASFGFSVAAGDVILLNGSWYVTHTGLIGLAKRSRCAGIHVQPVEQFCNPSHSRWAFEAKVFKSRSCKGFVGYGDADPSNVSPPVRGAEMRVAETRAVNRALRKAYGIGLCSVEEIGSSPQTTLENSAPNRRAAPESPNRNGDHPLRDRLHLIVRQHQLDPALVKAFAADFCGTKYLRDAAREQIEQFIDQLEQMATNDRDGLLCQLNSYAAQKQEGAA
jgi:hypothetical protein